MALIKASDVVDKKASNIADNDRLDILRRDLRSFALDTENIDRIIISETEAQVIENSDGTFDIDVNWKVDFYLGSKVILELQTKERTTLSSTSSTEKNSSHTFEDVDKQTSFIVFWVENSGDYRVSDRFLYTVIVDTEVGHNSLSSYAEPGSEFDRKLVQKEEDSIRESDLSDQATLVLDLFNGHHDQLVDIETHVDIIFGALTNFSSDPLVEQDVEDASKPASDTDLFPRDREKFYPKNPDWVTPSSFEESSVSNIQYYDSPHSGSSRTSGDQSEWQDLDDEIDNASTTESVAQTSIDNTNGVYTYDGSLSNSVNENSLVIEDGGQNIKIEDDGNGNLTGDVSTDGDAPNTIDYSTGDYHFDIDQSEPVNDNESLDATYDSDDNVSVDVFDETQGTSVTYNSVSELQDRQNEIETIVKDFNDEQKVWDEYDQRYDYIDHYSNRITGYKLQKRLISDVTAIVDEETGQSDDFESELGLTQ